MRDKSHNAEVRGRGGAPEGGGANPRGEKGAWYNSRKIKPGYTKTDEA